MQAASRFVINKRNGAMQQPGYISSETRLSIDEKDKIMVVSMWDTMEAWEAWKSSEVRKANAAEFKDYLAGEEAYEHYSLGLPME